MKISRRSFIKTAGIAGGAAVLQLSTPQILKVLAQAKDYWHLCWLNGGGCTGCLISFAQRGNPSILQVLTSMTVGNSGLPIALPDFMETLHPASGRLAMNFLEDWKGGSSKRKVLIVEGVVQKEGFCEVGGKDFRDLLAETARYADYVIAFGSCSSFGGIPHAKGNLTGAMGVADFFNEEGIDRPVIRLPRCPGHTDSLILTLSCVMSNIPLELDQSGRPTNFYGMNMHDSRCPYRPYYDRGIFVQKVGDFPLPPSEEGCRFRIGCKGPVTNVDCALRKWNNKVSYCVEVGAPCIGCSEPEFPDGDTAPFYKELPGLPLVVAIPAQTWGEAFVAISAIGIATHYVKRKLTKKGGE